MKQKLSHIVYADQLDSRLINHCIKSAIELETICKNLECTDESILGILFVEVSYLWLLQPTNLDTLDCNITSIVNLNNNALTDAHKLYMFSYEDGFLGIPCVDDAHFIELLNWVVYNKMLAVTIKNIKEEKKNG
jgi:hypothetical protein